MHITFEEERTVGEMLAALLGISGIPLSKRWRQQRAANRAQRDYEHGLPEVPGVRAAVPTGRERTVILERDMKFVRQSLDTLNTAVESIAAHQAETTQMIMKLDKKASGNGGDTYDFADVLQRVAKVLGVWEVGKEQDMNRRKDDEK